MGLYLSIGIFLSMQVAAGIVFKWGSTSPELVWKGLVFGNLIGAPSIYFLMATYTRMHPNLAVAICVGGAFLLTQIAFAVVFHAPMNPIQWGGVALMVVGIAVISCGNLNPELRPAGDVKIGMTPDDVNGNALNKD